MLRLSTRQGAVAFNQPLSFDTSKVTTMSTMFAVRSTRALAPDPSWVLARALHAPPPPHGLTPPGPHAALSTRQMASSFNQPLSLDTSSVTDMTAMFYVRSARALPPIRNRVLACTLRVPPPQALPAAPRPDAARVACPPFDSAERYGI